MSSQRNSSGGVVLSGVCTVVHEQELNVLGVLDEEDLVARGDHVSRLLVAAVADLSRIPISIHPMQFRPSQVLAQSSVCDPWGML